MIFLSKDELKLNFATCANKPVEPTPVIKDENAEVIAKQHEDIKLTELKVRKARLELELKEVNKELEPAKEMTEEEILEKSAARFKDRNTSGPRIVERWKAENAKIFKDNPVELKKENLKVDQWALNNLDKM